MPSQTYRTAAPAGRHGLVRIGFVAVVTLGLATAAVAKPPDDEAWLIRMLVCQGNGVQMELYLPQSVVSAPHSRMAAGQTANGYYRLDLTRFNKGKDLEPVRVTMSADKASVTVDQYARGLQPTRIPIGGATVDFDQRFGGGAKCGPCQAQDPNYGK